MQPIYFQPKGINPKYCEVGIIHESDPNYIWYMYEPCKVLISEVKIIPKENVYYDKKSRESMIINKLTFCEFLEFAKSSNSVVECK